MADKIKFSGQRAEEFQVFKQWDDYRMDPERQKRRFQNEQQYMNQWGGRSAVRITLPALTKKHLDSAVSHLEALVEELKAVQKTDTKIYHRINMMRSAVYRCHVDLKRDADDSRSMPNNPSNDYRGAK